MAGYIVALFGLFVASCAASLHGSCDDIASNCVERNGVMSMLADLEHNKPVEIFSGVSLQVEKLVASPKSRLGQQQGRMMTYLSSHAINLDFGSMSLQFGRSEEDPDKLELAIYVPEANGGRGRGKKTKILLPMLLGFKAISTLVVALFSVSLLTIKALFAAKMALVVAGAMAMKKLFDTTPPMHHGGGGGGSKHGGHQTSASLLNYNVEIPDAATYQSSSGYEGYANYGLSGQEAASSDLNSQFTSGQGMIEVAAPNATASLQTAAAAVAAAKRRDNLQRRRPFIAKQHPVFNYLKLSRP